MAYIVIHRSSLPFVLMFSEIVRLSLLEVSYADRLLQKVLLFAEVVDCGHRLYTKDCVSNSLGLPTRGYENSEQAICFQAEQGA